MNHPEVIGTAPIAEWQDEIQAYVLEKFGEWYKWEEAPKALMYIVSECGEAHETWRDDNPVAFLTELADVAIRTFDTAYWHSKMFGLDQLHQEMRRKMNINWRRPSKHGRVNV